jgi:hypothetical protein
MMEPLGRHLAAAQALQAQFELRRRNFSDPSGARGEPAGRRSSADREIP